MTKREARAQARTLRAALDMQAVGRGMAAVLFPLPCWAVAGTVLAFAAMPDKLTAEMIKNNFIAHGSDIFPKLLNALTQPGSEDDRPPAGLM